MEMCADALEPGDRILVIDDLLATGGTAAAAASLIERVGGEVLAMAFVVELEALKGRELLQDHKVDSLVTY